MATAAHRAWGRGRGGPLGSPTRGTWPCPCSLHPKRRLSPTCGIFSEDSDCQVPRRVWDRKTWQIRVNGEGWSLALSPQRRVINRKRMEMGTILTPSQPRFQDPTPNVPGPPPAHCPLDPIRDPGGPGPALTGYIEVDGPHRGHSGPRQGHLTGEVGTVVLGPWSKGDHGRERVGLGAQGSEGV